MWGSVDTMEKSFTAFVTVTPCMPEFMASNDASLFATALVLGVSGDRVGTFLGPMSLSSLSISKSEASVSSELLLSLLLLSLRVVAASAAVSRKWD